MLATLTAVYVISFLKVCSLTPLYNMQPAHITANIGTTGRNIRNLPCISRKTNQSGVCMFAIDCLKANGTHLGTCIDRFYFGSCCHVETHHQEIVDNNIDLAIIPPREPPLRVTNTTTAKPLTTSERLPTTTVKKKVTTEAPLKVTTLHSVLNASSLAVENKTSIAPTKATKRPSTTTIVTKPKPTRTTTKPIKFTKPPPSRTTTKPFRVTIKPSKTTTKRPLTTTTKARTTTRRHTTTPSTLSTTTVTPKNRTTAIPLTNITSTTPEVLASGNPETNEIEAIPVKVETTTKGGALVTWAIVDGQNASKPGTQEFQPLTTPDGWVLLPSVAPSTIATPTPPPTAKPSTSTPVTTTKATSKTTTTTTTTLKPVSTTLVPSTTTVTTTTRSTTTTSTTTTKLSSTATTPSSTTTTTTTTVAPKVNLTSVATSPVASSTESSTVVTNATTQATLNVSSTAIPEVTTSSADKPVNMSDYTQVCGRRMFPEARIVGGEKSSFGRWPWQISLRQWRQSTYLHKCGAALLNENWAITAAHCVENVASSDLLLRLGEHDLSTESEPYLHQERRVQIVVPFPHFDNRTFEYDLALLRFYEPVTFQPNIIPVCVPDTDENFVGTTAYVTGWGRLYEDGPLPSVLQEVSVPVINNTVCESMYRSAGYIEHIPHIFICAGWRRGGFDSCEGDSGGPMVIQRPDRRFILAGVISWGIGCAEPNQPGVYTRISEFREWINTIIQF